MKILKLFLIALLFVAPFSVNAATMRVTVPDSVKVGDTFSAEVFIDTEGAQVNALEGSVVLPNTLSVVDVRYSGSFISLWVTEPKERTSGIVDFAGVLPGGYQGNGTGAVHGNVFTLTLKAEQESRPTIRFDSSTKAYLNDGNGTLLPVSLNAGSVSVLPSDGSPAKEAVEKDTTPPESFTPIITSGVPYGLSGTVLVFSAADKNSGVSKYEVAHSLISFMPTFFMSWHQTISPYQVTSDDTERFIFVRATDRDGNTRIANVPPVRNTLFGLALNWILPLLLLIGIVFLGLRFKMSKR